MDGRSYTMWQPNHNVPGGSKTIFTVTFSKEVVLSKIELEQYRWSVGYAKLLRLEFSGGQNRLYRFRERHNGWVDRLTLMETQVRTSRIKFVVEEVSGYLFGGFAEIRFFGCAERNLPKDLEEGGMQYVDTSYDDYTGTGSPSSSSPSPSIMTANIRHGTYAGMGLGVICGIILFVIIIYALVVNSNRKDGDDVSRSDSENEEFREKELELREAIRQSVSEIVAGASVAGSLNLDEIEVISEEDMEGRGEV